MLAETRTPDGPAALLTEALCGPRRPIAPGGLLDVPAARSCLARVERAWRRDLYTFQLPLESASRARVSVGGRSMLMLSSYDYLGLIGHPRVRESAVAATRRYGTGAGGVRLLTGTLELHRQLERELARFKRTEAALTFTSGYLAALGLVPALFGPRDRVVADARAHRSLVDACRLARVPLQRFRHNDAGSLDRELGRGPRGARTLIVVEGAYSMDGDVCPLPEIVAVKHRHGAFLLVDEAHSFGVLGASGRGIDEHWGVAPGEVDIWVGSLSKAIPATGGFVAGARELILYLQHGAAPFVFSSALCPPAAAAALAAVGVLQTEPWRIAAAAENADRLRSGLRAMGYDTGASQTTIVPVVLGEDDEAYAFARALFDHDILATPVVAPAVARGGARLRLCATAAQGPDDIDQALAAFARLARRRPLAARRAG